MDTTEDLLKERRKEMNDYLITVTRKKESAFPFYEQLEEIRLIQVTDDYAEAFMDGVKAVYPKDNVYKTKVT